MMAASINIMYYSNTQANNDETSNYIKSAEELFDNNDKLYS